MGKLDDMKRAAAAGKKPAAARPSIRPQRSKTRQPLLKDVEAHQSVTPAKPVLCRTCGRDAKQQKLGRLPDGATFFVEPFNAIAGTWDVTLSVPYRGFMCSRTAKGIHQAIAELWAEFVKENG